MSHPYWLPVCPCLSQFVPAPGEGSHHLDEHQGCFALRVSNKVVMTENPYTYARNCKLRENFVRNRVYNTRVSVLMYASLPAGELSGECITQRHRKVRGQAHELCCWFWDSLLLRVFLLTDMHRRMFLLDCGFPDSHMVEGHDQDSCHENSAGSHVIFFILPQDFTSGRVWAVVFARVVYCAGLQWKCWELQEFEKIRTTLPPKTLVYRADI